MIEVIVRNEYRADPSDLDPEPLHVDKQDPAICPGIEEDGGEAFRFHEACKSPVADEIVPQGGVVVQNGYVHYISHGSAGAETVCEAGITSGAGTEHLSHYASVSRLAQEVS